MFLVIDENMRLCLLMRTLFLNVLLLVSFAQLLNSKICFDTRIGISDSLYATDANVFTFLLSSQCLAPKEDIFLTTFYGLYFSHHFFYTYYKLQSFT